MNPFDYLNAINTTKKDIMVDDISEKGYSPFMVNRGLSYFPDTILYANEMNLNHHIDHRLQFDFFINIIKKKKRFSKWAKPVDIENLELIKEYYGYSNVKAKSVLSLLNDEQINELKLRIYKGGKR
jgi:Holliday junction resolvase RusA-like endonuclease|tara:strand:- start:26 stop:403 length:378 start_codon:yes stop_codon:yes gene_type:complete